MQQKEMAPPQREEYTDPADAPKETAGRWDADELGSEASQMDEDEIRRRIRRGDETGGDAESRDAAGAPASIDTPHGREESKNDEPGAANQNG